MSNMNTVIFICSQLHKSSLFGMMWESVSTYGEDKKYSENCYFFIIICDLPCGELSYAFRYLAIQDDSAACEQALNIFREIIMSIKCK
jgi:hypothetical protein